MCRVLAFLRKWSVLEEIGQAVSASSTVDGGAGVSQ